LITGVGGPTGLDRIAARTEPSQPYAFGPRLLAAGLIFGLGILVDFFVWDFIELPFSNPEGIVGPLTLQSFNPANNLLRFVAFILVPAFALYLISSLDGRLLAPARTWPSLPANEVGCGSRSSIWRYAATFGMIAYFVGLFLLFFTQPFLPTQLHVFHEGEALTPAYKWLIGKGAWTGSLIVHGGGNDIFSTVLGWKLFGVVSIGAARVMWSFLDHAVALGGLVLVWTCFEVTRRNIGIAEALTLLALLLVGYTVGSLYPKMWLPELTFAFHPNNVLSHRDTLYLIGVASLIAALNFRSRALFFTCGFLGPCILMYSIEKGAYYSALSLVAGALYFYLSTACSSRAARIGEASMFIGYALMGWVVALSILCLAIGRTELMAMFETAWHWFRFKDYLDSYVYPNPLELNGGPRLIYRIPLLLCALYLFFAVYERRYLFSREGRAVSTIWVPFLTSGIFYYRWALGRSDPLHVVLAVSFVLLTGMIMLWIGIIRAGWFRTYLASSRVFRASVALLVLFAGLASLGRPFREIRALCGAGERIRSFVNLGDEKFLHPRQQAVLGVLKNLSAGGKNWIYVYTSEPGYYFLMRNVPRTRYFVTWHTAPREFQKELIKTLQEFPAAYVLFTSPLTLRRLDGISNADRFPYLHPWILEHYKPFMDVEGWQIWQLK
jgi:hypothetical protein